MRGSNAPIIGSSTLSSQINSSAAQLFGNILEFLPAAPWQHHAHQLPRAPAIPTPGARDDCRGSNHVLAYDGREQLNGR
jgi:hypothetical protein